MALWALLVRQKSSSATLLNPVASGPEPKSIHHRTLTFFAGQFDSAPVSFMPQPAIAEVIKAKTKLVPKKGDDSLVLAKKVSTESPFSEAVLLAEKFRLMRENRVQKSTDNPLIISGLQPK